MKVNTILFGTIALFPLISCGGTGGASNTSTSITECHEVTGLTPQQASDAVNAANDSGVPVEGDFTLKSTNVALCGGTIVTNDSQSTVTNETPAQKLISDIRSGDVERVIVRE